MKATAIEISIVTLENRSTKIILTLVGCACGVRCRLTWGQKNGWIKSSGPMGEWGRTALWFCSGI